MISQLRERLQSELESCGYSDQGEAPNGTMTLSRDYLDSISATELLDQLISRKHKLFKFVEVVGRENATLSYDDVALAVDALRKVISEALQDD